MFNRRFLYLITVFIFATSSVFAQSQDPPTANDLKRKIIKREKIDVAEGKWTYKVYYPELQLQGGLTHKEFSKVAKDIAEKQIKDFRKGMDGMTAEDWENRPTSIEYEMSFDYEVKLLNDDFVSVNFGRYEYTGGAHGNAWTITLNYDLKNNKVLQLKDLFQENSNYLNIISKTSIEQITRKQGQYAAIDWIKKGASSKPENFNNWNISEAGLMFTFDAYQVGPYAAGSFETIIPYSQFLSRMKSPLFIRASMASYIDGSPANTCRNGLFPSQSADFKLAFVKKEKAYFHTDEREECPNGVNCKTKSYVVAGDEVVIGRVYNNYACAWYQPEKGSETVGWLPLSDLTVQGRKSPKYNWSGVWQFYDNDVNIIPEKTVGDYVVKGNAFWKGLGDNVHIGEVVSTATPKNDLLKIAAESQYDCGINMQRVGKYLIISDNKNCGGMNVTFDGVYVQKVKKVTDSGADSICSSYAFTEMTYGQERTLNFRLGTIKTAKNRKVFFKKADGTKTNSYLVQGDEVIVSQVNNENACVWYQPKKGKETIGWISLNNLSFKPSSSIRQSWVGNWEFGKGEIKIIPQKRVGAYKVKALTYWVGKGEGNVNIGDIDFVAEPIANRLVQNGTENMKECKVKMHLLGNYLIVSDNDRCGGKNVTFDGIYRKSS